MVTAALRERLSSSEPAVGGWVTVDSPYVAQLLSHSGFDLVCVDAQHGMFGLDGALAALAGVAAGPAVPFARPPDLSPATIGKLLDGGAFGVIAPIVDTPEQAAQVVAACRYPPRGERSYGPGRAALARPDYLAHADDEVLVFTMVETATALDNLQAICATPGLDGVFVGPNDLSLSLGRPTTGGRDPQVQDAMRQVVEAAHGAGLWAGSYCADVDVARVAVAMGFDLVVPNADAFILRQAATRKVEEIRQP